MGAMLLAKHAREVISTNVRVASAVIFFSHRLIRQRVARLALLVAFTLTQGLEPVIRVTWPALFAQALIVINAPAVPRVIICSLLSPRLVLRLAQQNIIKIQALMCAPLVTLPVPPARDLPSLNVRAAKLDSFYSLRQIQQLVPQHVLRCITAKQPQNSVRFATQLVQLAVAQIIINVPTAPLITIYNR